MTVVRDDTAYPEVLWTFFNDGKDLSDPLANRLKPGINRGRVSLYANIDCNRFLPVLSRNGRAKSNLTSPKLFHIRLADAVLDKQYVMSEPVG